MSDKDLLRASKRDSKWAWALRHCPSQILAAEVVEATSKPTLLNFTFAFSHCDSKRCIASWSDWTSLTILENSSSRDVSETSLLLSLSSNALKRSCCSEYISFSFWTSRTSTLWLRSKKRSCCSARRRTICLQMTSGFLGFVQGCSCDPRSFCTLLTGCSYPIRQTLCGCDDFSNSFIYSSFNPSLSCRGKHRVRSLQSSHGVFWVAPCLSHCKRVEHLQESTSVIHNKLL